MAGDSEPSFVPAGYEPHLIKDVPFVLERKRVSGAIGAVDHQIVVTANSARERKALDSGGDEFAGMDCAFAGALSNRSKRDAVCLLISELIV